MLNFQELRPTKVISKGRPADFVQLPEDAKEDFIENVFEYQYVPWFKNASYSSFIHPSQMVMEKRSIPDLLHRSKTDGILIMHKGKVIYEKYMGKQTETSRHKLFSGTKSYVGILAQMLITHGILNEDALVTDIVPPMKDTDFEGATVRHLLDMTADFQFDENVYNCNFTDFDTKIAQAFSSNGEFPLVEGCEFHQLHQAASYWLHPPEQWMTTRGVPGPQGPANLREFLSILRKHPGKKDHTRKFVYRTANTDLLTWIIDEALKTLPEGHVDKGKSTSDYFESALWSQLGQGADALVAIDDSHVAYYGSGAMTTLQDMARLGEMLREGGKNKRGKQVVPKAVVDDLQHPPAEVFEHFIDQSFVANYLQAAGRGKGHPSFTGEGYRNQFWTAAPFGPMGRYWKWYPQGNDAINGTGVPPPQFQNETRMIFYQKGFWGQFMIVYPYLDMVVAKQSTDPEFSFHEYELLRAFEDLGIALSEL